MPEGDTVHRLARVLGRVLIGRAVEALSADPIPDALATSFVGRTISAVDARGKNLLVRFDDGRALHVHLRMLGRVRVDAPSRAPARAQLRLQVPGAVVTGRRIPVLRVLSGDAERRAPDLASLGPDLLADHFEEAEAVRRLRALGPREIGDALLAQRAVAGIGNVYKSEVLFLERVDPRATVATLSDDQLRALLARSRSLLQKNLGPGARRTRGALAGARLWVYGRRGRPCLVCGTPVASFRQGAAPGRTTYHCPLCQAC